MFVTDAPFTVWVSVVVRSSAIVALALLCAAGVSVWKLRKSPLAISARRQLGVGGRPVARNTTVPASSFNTQPVGTPFTTIPVIVSLPSVSVNATPCRNLTAVSSGDHIRHRHIAGDRIDVQVQCDTVGLGKSRDSRIAICVLGVERDGDAVQITAEIVGATNGNRWEARLQSFKIIPSGRRKNQNEAPAATATLLTRSVPFPRGLVMMIERASLPILEGRGQGVLQAESAIFLNGGIVWAVRAIDFQVDGVSNALTSTATSAVRVAPATPTPGLPVSVTSYSVTLMDSSNVRAAICYR